MISIEEVYELFLKYPLVVTDTRKCIKDALFFSLKGDSFNGNAFAQQAIDSGCAYAFVDEERYVTSQKTILVEDVLSTLQALAKLHRKSLKTPIVGITGTNGKTTTKELIASVLSKKYNTLCTQGNLNNHIGVPLTLLQLTHHHEIAVIEMGANHVGEIETLVNIVCPDFGIITNVGKAHLEGFGSFENIIKTKGELYDYIRSTGGKIFINEDNHFLSEISKGIEKIEYSLKNKEAQSFGEIISTSPMLEMRWVKNNNSYQLNTNLIGKYNAENVLAAVTIGAYFNVENKEIQDAIANYFPQNNRSQLTETKKNKLIIDAYNANPTSMEAAISNFKEMSVEGKKKAVVLGDMKELGEDSILEHQKIASFISDCQFEKVYLIGECFSSIKSPSSFFVFQNESDFYKKLQEENLQGYYILIKGSRGMKMEKYIDFL